MTKAPPNPVGPLSFRYLPTRHATGSSNESGEYNTRSGRPSTGTWNAIFPRTQSPPGTFASIGYNGCGSAPAFVPADSTRAPSSYASDHTNVVTGNASAPRLQTFTSTTAHFWPAPSNSGNPLTPLSR